MANENDRQINKIKRSVGWKPLRRQNPTDSERQPVSQS